MGAIQQSTVVGIPHTFFATFFIFNKSRQFMPGSSQDPFVCLEVKVSSSPGSVVLHHPSWCLPSGAGRVQASLYRCSPCMLPATWWSYCSPRCPSLRSPAVRKCARVLHTQHKSSPVTGPVRQGRVLLLPTWWQVPVLGLLDWWSLVVFPPCLLQIVAAAPDVSPSKLFDRIHIVLPEPQSDIPMCRHRYVSLPIRPLKNLCYMHLLSQPSPVPEPLAVHSDIYLH